MKLNKLPSFTYQYKNYQMTSFGIRLHTDLYVKYFYFELTGVLFYLPKIISVITLKLFYKYRSGNLTDNSVVSLI